MIQVRSWAVRRFAFPTVVLLGIANMGCPGQVSSSGPGGAGAQGGDGGSGAEGGAGGSACTPETEICDMKDNDCDGQVDEAADLPGGCDCYADSAPQECYSGRAGTAGVGTCMAGTQQCVDGKWGPCSGEVVPADEQCNLLDDDCNGVVDDMGQTSCGVGACMTTVDTCVGGQLQTCVPGQPSVEVCDGIDNNCNQLVDESDPMLNAACMTGNPGVCAAGKMTCNGTALVCSPDAMPTPEVCDGIDNNCDGEVDNGLPGTGGECSTGQLGVCAAGTISCKLSGGVYQIDCFSNVNASMEVCDGLDNNCNGQNDEGNPGGGSACDTGQLGICQQGTLNCVNGSVQCTPNAQAAQETCNGVDDNCDGQADEGNPGGNQPCGCGGAGLTACQNGTLVCNGGPITYFSEDFSDNSAGWLLDPEWQIGPAIQGPAGNCADPGVDTTPTADNGIAGVIIGGCSTSSVSETLHDYYFLTSPVINTASAQNVYLSFKRVLHSDYTPFMNNVIQVFNGTSWVQIWQSGPSPGIHDSTWQSINHDITAYKNANMRIRWGFNVGATGVFDEGSWSLDDILVSSAPCP